MAHVCCACASSCFQVDKLEVEPRTVWEMSMVALRCRDTSVLKELVDDISRVPKEEHPTRSLLYAYNGLMAAVERAGEEGRKDNGPGSWDL